MSQFKISENSDGTIQMNIFCGAPTSIKGNYDTTEPVFIYALFTGLIELEYQFKERKKSFKKETLENLTKYVETLGDLIRKIVLDEELEEVRDFNCKHFFLDMQKFVEKIETIGTKIATSEKLTDSSVEELKLINEMYEKLKKATEEAKIYDSIVETNEKFDKNDSRALQYMSLVLYKDLYIKISLWMSKRKVMFWEMKNVWNLLDDYYLLIIRKYFVKLR